MPLLLATCIQGVALLLLLQFHRPALLPIGLPLVQLLGGADATHYPMLFYKLPAMYARMNLVLDTLLVSVAAGASTLLFSRAFGLTVEGGVRRRVIRRAPVLILASAVTMLLLLGLERLTTLVPAPVIAQSFALRWGTRGIMMLAFVLIQSLMAYAAAWIVLMGHGLGSAIRDSVRVALRTFVPTFLAVGLPALILFPLSYGASVAGRLRPEMVATLLWAQIGVQMILTFFLVGAVTRLFVWRLEAAR